MKRQTKNLRVTGQRFGRYVVQSEAEPEMRSNSRGNIRRVVALCDCGNERTVHLQNLRSGKSQSCGCLSAIVTSVREADHGDSGSPEYACWAGMIQRCENPNVENWPRYGGRGIMVCERWRISYAAFLADMGRKPSPDHSIERIENDGDYEPNNCKWATSEEQRLNQRPRSTKPI